MGDGDEKDLFERARRRVRMLQALYIHAAVYVAVNLMLFAINVLTRSPAGSVQVPGVTVNAGGGDWWFYWPLLGWGIGLAIHAAVVLTFGSGTGTGWEERKIRELMDRERSSRAA